MLSPRSPEQLGIDEAVEMAKGCPILEGGGRIEVGETFEVM
jgi:hypothetical protein